MEPQSANFYKSLTDEELIQRILATPHDEEAAHHLLYVRYRGLLASVYNSIFKNENWLADCMSYLYLSLKGKRNDWHCLSTYEGKSKFSGWLRRVAFNLFLKLKSKFIDDPHPVPIDDPERPRPSIIDTGQESPEQKMFRVLLIEAVTKLKNEEMKLVITKDLEGFSHQEIALMIQELWRQNNIKKTYRGKPVVPDASYVDSKKQKAIEQLKDIIRQITLGCG